MIPFRRHVIARDRSVEAEIDDELAFHVDSRVAELRARGWTESEARRAALAEFGDVVASRRELAEVDRRRRRRMRWAGSASGMANDLRHAVRSLSRSHAYALAALATLVVGLGASTAMFAVVNGVLLRPLPYENPQRLVGLWHDMPAVNLLHIPQSVQTYFTYRTQATTIEDIAIYATLAANVAVVGQQTDAQRLEVGRTTASLFHVLGIRPVLGRMLSPDDDVPGAPPVAVLSERTWRNQFGGDRTMLGRKLDVNGVVREIVGVAPATLELPSSATALWIPLNIDPARPPADAFAYNGVARLKPGTTYAAAQRDFATVLPRAAELYPAFLPGITTRAILDQTKPIPVITSFTDDITGGVARTLWLIAGAALLLLFVACVNVSNLALIRFDAKRQELAVRLALGAAPTRAARGFVAEVGILVSFAGVVAMALAPLAVRLLVATAPANIPRLGDATVDWRCIAFLIAACACAIVACTAIPVVRIVRDQVSLRGSARGATTSHADARVRRVMVGAQIALALVALAGSALLIRSFERLQAVRPGFNADRVAVQWVSLPKVRYNQDSMVVRFSANLLERTHGIAGVVDASIASRVPLVARGFNDNPMYVEGAPPSAKLPPLQLFSTVSGEYFRTLNIPLLYGRTFDAIPVQREGDAIVSRRTAVTFWHDPTGQAALGKRFRVLPTSRWYTVVGVAADAHDSSLASTPAPTVYFPQTVYGDSAQRESSRTFALVVRTSGDPSVVVPQIRRVVRDLDPSLPLFDARPLADALRDSTARLRFTMLLLGGAALVTLSLGAIGLYGVMAYVVMLRRREIGIRLALGARPGAVAAATTGDALKVTGIGIAAGVVTFMIVARFAQSLLFQIAPWDPIALASASLILLATAFATSGVPALRASRVDPAETLRGE